MTVAVDPTGLILQKIRQLPPLPLVVRKLIAIMQDDHSTADDVREALCADQALAGQVLKLVNSSFYGLSGEVSTISRAIVVLGFAAIRNLATGLGVAGIMARTGKGDVQQRFWDHAIVSAAAGEVLAKHTRYPDPEEAFVACLLHDIGHLILGTAVPRTFAEVVALGPRDMVENEARLIGMTHARAGQKLMQHWKLPVRLAEAVRHHHNSQVAVGGDHPLVSLVAMADALACVNGPAYEWPIAPDAFPALVTAAGMDVRETAVVLAEMDRRAQETRLFLKIAAEEELPSAAESKQRPLRLVLLGTDPIKAEWARGVLQHFGHSLLPMTEFFAQADCALAPDLVILDPAGCTAEQMQRMKPALQKHQDRCVALGAEQDGVVLPALGLRLPCLPLVFSRSDLAAHAG